MIAFRSDRLGNRLYMFVSSDFRDQKVQHAEIGMRLSRSTGLECRFGDRAKRRKVGSLGPSHAPFSAINFLRIVA
jgi:hypothetical protein